MNDYIFLMHADHSGSAGDSAAWGRYISMLRATGKFEGGSSMGDGMCVNHSGTTKPITAHLSGYMLIQAQSLEDARTLLVGNPVLDAGGTVEIRELPRD